jgi:hypothetical protein
MIEAMKILGIAPCKEAFKQTFGVLFDGSNFGGVPSYQHQSQPAWVDEHQSKISMFDLSLPAITERNAKYCYNPTKVDTRLVNLDFNITSPRFGVEDIRNAPPRQSIENGSDDVIIEPYVSKSCVRHSVWMFVLNKLNDKIGNLQLIYPIDKFKEVFDEMTLGPRGRGFQEPVEQPAIDVSENGINKIVDEFMNLILVNQVTKSDETNQWLVV